MDDVDIFAVPENPASPGQQLEDMEESSDELSGAEEGEESNDSGQEEEDLEDEEIGARSGAAPSPAQLVEAAAVGRRLIGDILCLRPKLSASLWIAVQWPISRDHEEGPGPGPNGEDIEVISAIIPHRCHPWVQLLAELSKSDATGDFARGQRDLSRECPPLVDLVTLLKKRTQSAPHEKEKPPHWGVLENEKFVAMFTQLIQHCELHSFPLSFTMTCWSDADEGHWKHYCTSTCYERWGQHWRFKALSLVPRCGAGVLDSVEALDGFLENANLDKSGADLAVSALRDALFTLVDQNEQGLEAEFIDGRS